MYGAIPITETKRLKQKYSIASPATWQFEKDGITYGCVEEKTFSKPQQAEIASLGGRIFASAEAFNDWMTEETQDLTNAELKAKVQHLQTQLEQKDDRIKQLEKDKDGKVGIGGMEKKG